MAYFVVDIKLKVENILDSTWVYSCIVSLVLGWTNVKIVFIMK